MTPFICSFVLYSTTKEDTVFLAPLSTILLCWSHMVVSLSNIGEISLGAHTILHGKALYSDAFSKPSATRLIAFLLSTFTVSPLAFLYPSTPCSREGIKHSRQPEQSSIAYENTLQDVANKIRGHITLSFTIIYFRFSACLWSCLFQHSRILCQKVGAASLRSANVNLFRPSSILP